MAEERFDEVLLNVAGQCGGIEPLFDVIFSFLYRKTDFFHIMKPGDKMGFPEGVAEKLLLRNFRRYEMLAKSAVAKAEITARETKDIAPAQKSNEAGMTSAIAVPSPAMSSAPSSAAPQSEPSDAKGEGKEIRRGHLKDFVDVPYNGSSTSKYSWEQTINDVTITARVPKGTKARDVVCVIGKSHLLLKLKGEATPILDGDYPCDKRNGNEIWEKVRTDECYWNLSEDAQGDHSNVSIYLEKERETWWKSALHGEEEIDTTKVDSTRSMYDYDSETQGAIRKIMFDQDQKRKGLPSSDDAKNEELLRKAWDAEGSPFKGTPFDPHAINFNGGSNASGSA
mmetsp:Transcript_18974/g.45501  ORF Transcript_18974/g.45501 Transcript_18974/m.45501 type:complete len:339 (+) Transcript_18974:37-1053(+)